MAGYLIAEEGPLSGLIVRFEGGTEWSLGRDPDEVGIVLEDPMVSRKHVIVRKTEEGYLFDNLSSVNPATQNGMIISEPVLLREGDIIQIGNTFFRFTEKNPETDEPTEKFKSDVDELSSLSITSSPETKWLLKVVTGPNTGAEFYMPKGSSYIVGKDQESCDIVFQDLSVSRQHAKITVDEGDHIYIEDLGSRNGTLVNGIAVVGRQELSTQDLVSLGTTTFVVVDRLVSQSTLISPPSAIPKKEESVQEETVAKEPIDWREMVISKRHLVLFGMLGVVILITFVSLVSLFQSEPTPLADKHQMAMVEKVIKSYPEVQFSFTEGMGKIFLTGHVLTSVDSQELLYQLRGLNFLRDIENNVVIDELVWQNMNAILITNPEWQGISIHSSEPGKFVARGYLQTADQAQMLSDYLNMNFPYLDRLDNQVVIESTLITRIQSSLLEKGFNNVAFQIINGELVLSGRIDGKDQSSFEKLLKEFKTVRGVRLMKNFVIYTTEDSSLVDLSSKYSVMGISKKDGENEYIVINGRVLTIGDSLDGMTLVAIQPALVLLEKDGLKFKINYNLQ